MLANNTGNNTPEKNYEMAIKDVKKPSSKGYHLSMSCPGIQTDTLVKMILDDYPQDMLVDSGLNLTLAREQSLRILQKIKQTFICFDYKGAKARVMIDMSKAEIIPEKGVISIFDNEELVCLSKFIIDNSGDIHLPNGILRVEVEPGKKDGEFVFKAKKYYSSCNRAQRNALRVELNGNTFAKRFFKNIQKGVKLPDNEYLLTSEGGIGIGIVANISDKGLGIFIPKFLKPIIESKTNITLVLPFLGTSIKINFAIKKIMTMEEDDYCEIGGVIGYIGNDNERRISKNVITQFIWATNKKIGEEFNAMKEGHEGIEKIEIKPKDL